MTRFGGLCKSRIPSTPHGTAVKVATDAVQIMGAYGTTSKSGAEKYFRDAKMMQIVAGTNEICRLEMTAPLLPYAGLGVMGSD